MKQKRLIRKEILFTEQEFQLFAEKAQKFGTFSAYVRMALLHFDGYVAKDRFDMERELGEALDEFEYNFIKIGTNVNQIAHQVNSFAVKDVAPGKVFFDQNVVPLLTELDSLYKDILKTYRKILFRTRK